jgi:hypothetical protein
MTFCTRTRPILLLGRVDFTDDCLSKPSSTVRAPRIDGPHPLPFLLMMRPGEVAGRLEALLPEENISSFGSVLVSK